MEQYSYQNFLDLGRATSSLNSFNLSFQVLHAMTQLKLTVLKRQDPAEIFDELPVAKKDWMVPCDMYTDGQEMILDKLAMPEGFCPSAWQTIYPNMRTLFYGGDLPFFKEKGTAITCCADGMRPVIFKIERI